MPTNTFGPNDNYDSLNSHFFPALIKKAHKVKKSDLNMKDITIGKSLPKGKLFLRDSNNLLIKNNND